MYRSLLRIFLNAKNRKRLTNKNFTIICNNCVGGVILHELGQRFNSPTINLFFRAEDYIRFLENLDYYLEQELTEIQSNRGYPVAKLKDIIIYFIHYQTFAEAREMWKKRTKRINRKNMYIIMVQQSGCTEAILKRFDNLPYRHKVVFVSAPMPSIKCSYYIPGSERPDGEVRDLCAYKGKVTGRRWIDEYNYVDFLNKRENEKK